MDIKFSHLVGLYNIHNFVEKCYFVGKGNNTKNVISVANCPQNGAKQGKAKIFQIKKGSRMLLSKNHSSQTSILLHVL